MEVPQAVLQRHASPTPMSACKAAVADPQSATPLRAGWCHTPYSFVGPRAGPPAAPTVRQLGTFAALPEGVLEHDGALPLPSSDGRVYAACECVRLLVGQLRFGITVGQMHDVLALLAGGPVELLEFDAVFHKYRCRDGRTKRLPSGAVFVTLPRRDAERVLAGSLSVVLLFDGNGVWKFAATNRAATQELWVANREHGTPATPVTVERAKKQPCPACAAAMA